MGCNLGATRLEAALRGALREELHVALGEELHRRQVVLAEEAVLQT